MYHIPHMKHWSSRYPFGSTYVFKSHVLSVQHIRHSSKSFKKNVNSCLFTITRWSRYFHLTDEELEAWGEGKGSDHSALSGRVQIWTEQGDALAMCLFMVSYCVQEKAVTHVISDASSHVIQTSEFGSQVQQDLRKSIIITMNSSPKV